MQKAQCDKKGRLYLREAVRARYGDRFMLVEAPEELVLIPLPSNSVHALAELGQPVRSHSIAELRTRIRKRAKKEVLHGK